MEIVKMQKTVKVKTDNKVTIVDIPWTLDGYENAVDARCVEFVSTQFMYDFFKMPVVMIVDESGLCKNKPLNKMASELYGYPVHGNYIAGDVIFGVRVGADILPPENVELLKFYILDNFSYLVDGDLPSGAME